MSIPYLNDEDGFLTFETKEGMKLKLRVPMDIWKALISLYIRNKTEIETEEYQELLQRCRKEKNKLEKQLNQTKKKS